MGEEEMKLGEKLAEIFTEWMKLLPPYGMEYIKRKEYIAELSLFINTLNARIESLEEEIKSLKK
jgi:hypothetical protein